MNPETRNRFPHYIETFEGRCAWMYLDTKCLVTTAVGNLIDPLGQAIHYPWQDGAEIATTAQVQAEWDKVKSLKSMSQQGGGAFARVTSLRLSEAFIDSLVNIRAVEMWHTLLDRWPDAEQWPWQAQLATLSMAWCLGPCFHFPRFDDFAKDQNWLGCMNECIIQHESARNAANQELFAEAMGAS